MSAIHAHCAFPDARYLGPRDDQDHMEVTVVLRRRADRPALARWPSTKPHDRASFGDRFGADPLDIEKLRGFAQEHGLQETDCQAHRRVMRLRGSVPALQRAFGVELGHYQATDGRQFVGCKPSPRPDQLLGPHVIAVLGLDQRPVAKAHFRVAQQQPSQSFTPVQVGQLYGYPADTDGSGQTIALIELGGGYQQDDLDQYFASLKMATPNVTAIGVAGGGNQPGGDADGEVLLDIEVAGALAPEAAIAVYFAPNTDQGFYEAISQAAHDTTHKPSVMSISWGGPEASWSEQSFNAMQSALEDALAMGVTVLAAAGDDGSSDGESDNQPHVDFPASSQYTIACGGTKLQSSDNSIVSEVVWNETASNEGATGGGVSTKVSAPDWQSGITLPEGKRGRGVPDVAGNADPLSGYQVRVDGQDTVIGGTSAVAPLWAALIARLNQSLGTSLGDVHAALYQIGATAFNDIAQGNNGRFDAGKGWDACTGWGSPKGQALLEALQGMKQS
ncbi:S53 family serine peptidase [Dyella sp.]|uniref:S53 family peptidase n=1 Tax=Dyella sp. TaxID=1869338 RepID=UPI002ED4BE21